MTKKHMIALADTICTANKVKPRTFSNRAIEELADFCYQQNPRFLRGRWMDYIAGKCGKNGGEIK